MIRRIATSDLSLLQPSPSSVSVTFRLNKSEWTLLLLIGGILLFARLAIAGTFELQPDEALYAFLSTRAPLAWGSFPPGVLLLGRLGMTLGGKTELALRFPSILLTTSAIWPFYLLARTLWDARTARHALFCFAGVPVFTFFGSTLTPDGAQLCVWCWLLLWCWRALHTATLRDWLIVGLLGGVGLWIKYPLALFWPSLGLALVLCPAWRSQWRLVLLAGVVCVLCVMFPLLSQYASGAQALRYQVEERQQWSTPQPGDLGVWYGSHALYYSPLLYIGCLATLWWGLRHWRGDATVSFCFSFGIVTWVIFAFVTTFTRRILHREHWDALAYPPLILLLPYLWQQMRWKVMANVVAAPALLFTALTTLEAVTRLPSRAVGKGPLFWHERGWRAMAHETDRRLTKMPPQTLVVGESFVNATEYWFYGAHPERARCLDSAYNARFGVAFAVQQTGLVWPHAPEPVRPILSIGGPYSLPPDLALWDKNLHRHAAFRNLPTLQVRLDGKVLKTFYYKAFEPQKSPSLKSVKERYILLKRRKGDGAT